MMIDKNDDLAYISRKFILVKNAPININIQAVGGIMIYSVISVGSDDDVRLLEINNERIGQFFRDERKMFSGSVMELNPQIQKKIILKMGSIERYGYVHIFSVIDLAGSRDRPDVFKLIKRLQKELSCIYLVGR